MFDAYISQIKQLEDFSKGMTLWNFGKRLVGTWKSSNWSRYFLSTFYRSNTPFSLWWCFVRSGITLSYWFIPHKTHIWIINFNRDHVCKHVHPPPNIFLVSSAHFFDHRCSSSLLFDKAALWLVIFLYVCILLQSLESLGEPTGVRSTSWQILLYGIDDVIRLLWFRFFLPPGKKDATISIKYNLVFVTLWWSLEPL